MKAKLRILILVIITCFIIALPSCNKDEAVVFDKEIIEIQCFAELVEEADPSSIAELSYNKRNMSKLLGTKVHTLNQELFSEVKSEILNIDFILTDVDYLSPLGVFLVLTFEDESIMILRWTSVKVYSKNGDLIKSYKVEYIAELSSIIDKIVANSTIKDLYNSGWMTITEIISQ
jgi:hypothetical protein